jgi:acyl carrier protein
MVRFGSCWEYFPSATFNITRITSFAMTREIIFEEIQGICVQLLRVPPEKVVPDTRLIEDLEIDSLFGLELALGLEKRFNIEVPANAVASFKTVSDLADYVDRRLVALPK